MHWLQHTDIHPLVASCVFHYEFEFIHPFADGNGRMGRLWQRLILSEWRAELAWLPVETLIHNQQQEYYRVLGECDRVSDCSAFISFMLDKLREALAEGLAGKAFAYDKLSEEMSEENRAKLSKTAQNILGLLADKPMLTIAQLATELVISSRTIERHLKVLPDNQKIKRIGATKNGRWRVV
ncbi:Fic family protein [Rouxiella aceris]|uniref:Fic family protein n=1 Tax=Rouxiella aceris TaxID=2703884 RepID=UPI002E2C65CA|nr:Fic family protein [Rouxiella aceris]